jgi:uncharacterized SAM-binding protein YcdF (DUF218 family)
MVVLRHLLPMLIMPTMLALVFMAIGIFTKRRRFLIVGVCILWLFSTPIASDGLMRAAEGWSVRQPAAAASNADAIVVLSGTRHLAPGPAAVTEWNSADRFDGGVELMQARKAPLLVFNGAWSPLHPTVETEGETLVRIARSLGIGADSVVTTDRVGTTSEEASAVARLLKAYGIGNANKPRILLVTSAYHMRRARLLFERADMAVTPFPVDFQVPAEAPIGVLNFVPSGTALRQSEVALRELYAWVFYRIAR